MFLCMFYLVFEIFKQHYEMSNSFIEISYDFHNEAVLIYKNKNCIKANKVFVNNFKNFGHFTDAHHYSQMITEVEHPDEIYIEFLKANKYGKISILELIQNKDEYNEQEFILRDEKDEKVFQFSTYELDNIYNSNSI